MVKAWKEKVVIPTYEEGKSMERKGGYTYL